MSSLYVLAVQGALISYLGMLFLDYHLHFLGFGWSSASFSFLYDADTDDESLRVEL